MLKKQKRAICHLCFNRQPPPPALTIWNPDILLKGLLLRHLQHFSAIWSGDLFWKCIALVAGLTAATPRLANLQVLLQIHDASSYNFFSCPTISINVIQQWIANSTCFGTILHRWLVAFLQSDLYKILLCKCLDNALQWWMMMLMPTQEFPDRIWLGVVDRTQPKHWGEMRLEDEKQQLANDE